MRFFPSPSAAGVRVLLVSPESQQHPILDRYIKTHEHIDLVGHAASEHHALQLFFSLKPDVTLLDQALCESEPARFVAVLKRVAPDARIVYLTLGETDGENAHATHLVGAETAVSEAALPAWLDRLAAP